MVLQTRLRRWGNSLGVIIPMEIVQEQGLTEGEEILIELTKKNTLLELFGSLPKWNINSQKVKNILRKEWEH